MSSLAVLDSPNAFSPIPSVLDATGRHYVHSVHALLECPDVADGSFALVERTVGGEAEVLLVGEVDSGAPSLNLAKIRQLGARLGCSIQNVEVHLYCKPRKLLRPLAMQ